MGLRRIAARFQLVVVKNSIIQTTKQQKLDIKRYIKAVMAKNCH